MGLLAQTMNTSEQIIAFPGHALIGMKPRYGDFEGQIAIPGTARSKTTTGRLGMVCSVNPYPKGRDSMLFEDGEPVSRPAWKLNGWYTGLLGKNVICRNATLLWGQLYSVRLEFIEAEAIECAEAMESGVDRCSRCRSAGEANILMGPDGYCPVCGLNRYGEHIDSVDIRETFSNDRSLVDALLREPMEEFVRRQGSVRGTVFSFPGQRYKGGRRIADLSEKQRRILKG